MATDQKSIASAIVWLEGLADLCVHGSEGRPTKGRLKQIAEQLCELLPSAAFTSASARLCAKGDFFPGFDTMQTRLAEYWAAARPSAAPLLLPPDVDVSSLTTEDRRWLDFWYRERQAKADAEDAIRQRGGWTDEAQLPLVRFAGFIRRHSPRAWAVISGQGQQGRPQLSEAEISESRERLRETVHAIRGGADPRAAPVARQLGALPTPAPASRAVPLSPDLLAERRAAAGIPVVAKSASGMPW